MFALKAPHVFDGERFLRGGATVLVEDARIRGVEPLGFETPADCPVTTYAGTLLPGLVDAHVHLVCDSSPTALTKAPEYDPDELDAVIASSLDRHAAAGVTAVRDLGDVGYRTLGSRDHPSRGAPRVAVSGPPLTVPGGHCHFLGGVVDGEQQIRAAVHERAERGVDVVKVMATGGMLTAGTDVFGTQFSPDELRCVVGSAHEAGLPVLAHAHSLAGARLAVAAGVDGLEHATCLTPEGPQFPDDLLEDLASADVAVCVTTACDREVMRAVAPPPNIAAACRRMGMDQHEMLAVRIAGAARMHAAGVRVVNGVDAGVMPAKPHGLAWRGVADLAEGGVAVAPALASATSVAADALGLGATTGRLAPSYDADLLVVNGDVSADPEVLADVAEVVVRGVRRPGGA